ncbi:hypothetical protein EYF80_040853 [Liparis tanakae]|uniref:Uncharacterized protein n=1 Tax=Liparis tanakae TaxID=230148 RepID=A0A4Z2G7Q9_9TELE|nr:hypothetical protein EYF80_040853 [Liparis tanakae]
MGEPAAGQPEAGQGEPEATVQQGLAGTETGQREQCPAATEKGHREPETTGMLKGHGEPESTGSEKGHSEHGSAGTAAWRGLRQSAWAPMGHRESPTGLPGGKRNGEDSWAWAGSLMGLAELRVLKGIFVEQVQVDKSQRRRRIGGNLAADSLAPVLEKYKLPLNHRDSAPEAPKMADVSLDMEMQQPGGYCKAPAQQPTFGPGAEGGKTLDARKKFKAN